MKYAAKSFSVGGHSRAYSDNFDAIFASKKERAMKECDYCGKECKGRFCSKACRDQYLFEE